MTTSAVLAFPSRPLPSPLPSVSAPKTGLSGPSQACSDPLPPLAKGLPNTPTEQLQLLFAATLVQGLKEKDSEWVNSPDFETVGVYAGLELNVVFKIRDMYQSGKLDMSRLIWWNTGMSKEVAA